MKILFFAPFSAIWIHAFPEALVAEALKQDGNEILYVGCGGLLSSHCVPMIARGVGFDAPTADKQRVCRACVRNREIIVQNFEFQCMDLQQLCNDADFSIADSLMLTVTRHNCLDFVSDGVEIGRIASYELLIQNKKTDFNFSDPEWHRYLANFRNSLLTLRVMRRVLSSARPDRVFVYNALYSINRVVCRLAEIEGIPQYFLHAGDNLSNRLQTLILGRHHAFTYYQKLREKWAEIRDRPGAEEGMRAATDHFIEVARGKSLWAYSEAPDARKDLRKHFGFGAEQKIICATMSSDDERFSAEITGTLSSVRPEVFPSQVEWIRALISYVATRDSLALIVRVHPREFPNKRERTLSEHAKMLQVELSSLPNNVKVNWPTDSISLYDLAGVTSVFANSWSSAGKEMAWLGLPVILYSRDLTLYPSDLNYVGTTREEYFRVFEQALREGWSAETIRRTYRWCAVEYRHASFSIAESFSRKEGLSLAARATGKIMREILPSREQQSDCRRRARRLSSAEIINEAVNRTADTLLDVKELAAQAFEKETSFLKSEVGRLAAGVYGSSRSAGETTLLRELRKFACS